jgi:carbon monoxide dehydrogenase subunit G
MLVNESPSVVWKVTTDISAWPNIYPYTYSAEPVSRQSNATLVKVRLGVPLLKANIYMTMVADKASYEMTTRLNKQGSSPLAKEMRSSTKLLPQAGGKTLIVYSCVTEVSFSPIMAVLGRGVIRDMENVLLRLPKLLKQYVESPAGAKYR